MTQKLGLDVARIVARSNVVLPIALKRIASLEKRLERAMEMLRLGQAALANDGIDIGQIWGVPETEEWSKRLDAFLAQYEHVESGG